MVELKYSVYKCKDVTFIVSPQKIFIQTALAEYTLDPEEWYNNEDLPYIIYLIEKGKITDMKSLRSKIVGKFYLISTKKRHELIEI